MRTTTTVVGALTALFAGAIALSAAPTLVVTTTVATSPEATTPVSYEIDVRTPDDDRFEVVVHLEGLTNADGIFQFASTTPGTYQVMDIGRYVEGFQATDADGRLVRSERISVNQWRLSEPARVRTIRYSIGETWDTPVTEHPVYRMAGTSLEADHALINAHAVFGFPLTWQDQPTRVRFHMPADWRIGTPLVADAEGWYAADDYDHLVDSPFLLGNLTSASLDVLGVPVEVWVFSQTGVIQAEALLGTMEQMLLSAGEFLDGLPVDRYAFLWYFGAEPSAGAWEHSYSSEYVYREPAQWSEATGQTLTDVAAHEFFHVVTPLNIHSEIIEHFDFEQPQPSRHLWLYEGVTEWASDVMQLRSRLLAPEDYLQRVAGKIDFDARAYDPELSLTELALTSYSNAGQRQFGNVYQRGAVVAGLLDIRLLELSGGRLGLRELMLDLAAEYGPERPFPDDALFEIITDRTFPEVADFFRRFVRSPDPLPIAEYYEKLGIRYNPEFPRSFEMMEDATPEQLALRRAWLALRATA